MKNNSNSTTRLFTLVTGSSMGIGKALACECAQRGLNLLLVALPGDELEDTAAELHDRFHVDVHTLAVDLTDLEGPAKVHQWCTENEYTVNMLINNAGIGGTAVFGHSDPSYSDKLVMLNIRALTLLTHLFLPSMKKLPEAYILNIGSMSAFFSIPYKTVYSSSKAYVLNFTRALKAELRNSPVSISVLCPNGVQTNSGVGGRIKAHGWKGNLTTIAVDQLSKEAIDKMLKKQTVIIPGFPNKLLVLLNKITPRALSQYFVIKEFEKEVRDS